MTERERESSKRLKGWESESVPKKKGLHAETSGEGGAIHFLTHTAFGWKKVHVTHTASGKVFECSFH